MDFSKVDRANELRKTIEAAEAELQTLFGGEAKPKRTWTRRKNGAGTEGTMEGTTSQDEA